MDRPYRDAREERDVRDAIGVDFRETGHGFVHDSLQVSVLYVTVSSVKAILRSAMIRQFVGLLNPNVSKTVALATHSSVTTVSFYRPRKSS